MCAAGEAVVAEVGVMGAMPEIGEAPETVGALPVAGVSDAGVGELSDIGEPEEVAVGTMALPGGACGDWLAVGKGLATAAGALLTGGEMTGLADTGELLITVVPTGELTGTAVDWGNKLGVVRGEAGEMED